MNAIVCIDANFAIGYKNKLLYHIPDDLKHFKQLTLNKNVIMGRKTLESLPGGKPLPNRRNIVFTRQKDYSRDDADIIHDIGDLQLLCVNKQINPRTIWVIGGESIYDMLLPYCNYLYITLVHDIAKHADAHFPNLFEQNIGYDDGRFYCISSKSFHYSNICYSFMQYVQSNKYVKQLI